MIDEKKLIEDIHKYFYKKIEELTGEIYDDSPVTKEERELYTMNKEICGIIKAQPTIEPYGMQIPVSSRKLPKEHLESVNGWDEYRNRCVFVRYDEREWILGDHESVKIIAWMPLPKPYKEEKK